MRTWAEWSGVKLIADTDEDLALLQELWNRIPVPDKNTGHGDDGWIFEIDPKGPYAPPGAKAVLSICTQ